MNNIDTLRLHLLDLNIQVRDLKREVDRINQADREFIHKSKKPNRLEF